MNFDSHYKSYADTIHEWFNNDSEDWYKSNLKKNPELLNRHNWLGTKITYRFNSDGFRCKDFDLSANDNVMFVGCSLTFGLGINEKDRWTDIVSESLNLKCCNFGTVGGSADTSFRFTYGWIEKIQPKLLVLRVPPGVRIELINDDSMENIMFYNKKKDPFLRQWFVNENNINLNIAKNILAMQYLCDRNSVKFVVDKDFDPDFEDLARDLDHPGIKSNKSYAGKILSLIS